MSNKSGSSDQFISLPKGGGALKGIGETFTPDLHTGTGNFSIPIALPPGRNGFQPEINLVYSTGNGNGPFGLGWNLSVPGVSRKTSRGIPRYLDESAPSPDRDVYLLSGVEDLVPLEISQEKARYRPRTEGLFARIEHHFAPGTDHWEVLSKDGKVTVYGSPQSTGSDPAVIADPANRNKAFSWKATETRDCYGNRILYEYERDAGETVDHFWDQLYLKRIRYIDYTDEGAEKFLVSVTFVYEERPDPFSDRRAGFEIRTRLRCTRIEVRTHADQERLVRVFNLVYLDQRGLPPERLPFNGVSLLSQVVVEGQDGPRRESLPPLEFGYTTFEPALRRYRAFSAIDNALPNRSLGDPEFELVDLFGNGLPDVFQMDGVVRFWRNLGGGVFDFPRSMPFAPAGVELADPGVQIADLNGDGRADLLVTDGLRGGFFPLTFAGGWDQRSFVAYRDLPATDLDAPDVRMLDLDGDGVIDALRTGTNFELYYNDPDTGWSEVDLLPRGDPQNFPNVTLTDPRVKLGDMSGDGLQDIVFISNGRVDYWPYLGYGRWGSRITMRNSPCFEDAAFFSGIGFDPKRLLLGDVDGDGLADLVYVSSGHIMVCMNQGGEAWSDPIEVYGTPPVANTTSIRLADMEGTGITGILWTYDLGTFGDSTYKFLDLTGGVKPYLLNEMDNQHGAITQVGYTSSTEFYRADQERPETRWRTPLPFPVQVVAKVEMIDLISLSKLTTEYRYHDGYWDGVEREFRGFGMVEELDSQIFEDYNRPGLHGEGVPFERVGAADGLQFSPPTLTRNWFHQGAVDNDAGGSQESDYQAQFWPEDPPVLTRPAVLDQLLDNLQPRDRRDALRSLRGSLLRKELYSLDGSELQDRPYTVIEVQHSVREESPPDPGDEERRRIFFPHLLARRTTQWERGSDPMTQFTFSGSYDPYGQVREQVEIAVPRGRDFRHPAASAEPYLAVLTQTDFSQRDDEGGYLVDRTARTTSFEILNDGSLPVFEFLTSVREGTANRRISGQTLTYYDGEAFTGLPFGQPGDFGAPVRTETLVLTEEILRQAYRSGETVTDPPELPPYLETSGPTSWTDEYPLEFQALLPPLAGFIFYPGDDEHARGYFSAQARNRYDFHQTGLGGRGLLTATQDPLGQETFIEYDQPFDLLPVRVANPAGLENQAQYNYRLLQPEQATDPNGNRSIFSFTPLGAVETISLMGKDGEDTGDTLVAPSVRLVYDLEAFTARSQPISVKTIRRVHHVTETGVPPTEREETIQTVEFTDGFGRLVQTRSQAEQVLFGDEIFGGGVLPSSQNDPQDQAEISGRESSDPDNPNVVVSGWQIYDNKGRVVEKFEPLFSKGFAFESLQDAPPGKSIRMFYDPRGQLIRSVNPDGSEQRVIYGVPTNLENPEAFSPTPWEAFTYDANDNAGRTHPGQSAGYQDHWNTPTSIEIDAMGRTIKTVQRTGQGSGDSLVTTSTYDIRGNLLTITDPLGRKAVAYSYDLANQLVRTESIDAGLLRMVLDARGKPTESRDGKGALILHALDRLSRPVRLWARDGTSAPVSLRERLEYGDAGDPAQPGAERSLNRQANRLGRLHRHFDEAGLITVEAYDFKGNVSEKTRQVVKDSVLLEPFNSPPQDWQVQVFRIDWETPQGVSLFDHATALLEDTVYTTSFEYDALSRPRSIQYPQDSDGERKELLPKYNRAGALERVELNGRVFVEQIAYNARGQRVMIAYGNGALTRYAYDPQNFRLARLRTERFNRPDALVLQPNGTPFQDFVYEFDLTNNLLSIHDRAPGCGIPGSASGLDALDHEFAYDPLYRLVSADGREHALPPPVELWNDVVKTQDPNLARPYVETYVYDRTGNLEELRHQANGGSFTRTFILAQGNDRLSEVHVGPLTFRYFYDAVGNLIQENSSRFFEWGHSNRLKSFRVQAEGAEPSIHTQYLYDPEGNRVKKLVRRQGGSFEVTIIIDGLLERHRRVGPGGTQENDNLHVMDGQSRIALIRAGAAFPGDTGPDVQFHLGDHLGSSSLVLDEAGDLVNREEYTPYGETTFGSFARKRYRFSGKERDEESGLYFFGARYYAPWLARWVSCDPLLPDGPRQENLYVYALNNPLKFSDPKGLEPTVSGSASYTNPASENDLSARFTYNYPQYLKLNLGTNAPFKLWGLNWKGISSHATNLGASLEKGDFKLKLGIGLATSFDQKLDYIPWPAYDTYDLNLNMIATLRAPASWSSLSSGVLLEGSAEGTGRVFYHLFGTRLSIPVSARFSGKLTPGGFQYEASYTGDLTFGKLTTLLPFLRSYTSRTYIGRANPFFQDWKLTETRGVDAGINIFTRIPNPPDNPFQPVLPDPGAPSESYDLKWSKFIGLGVRYERFVVGKSRLELSAAFGVGMKEDYTPQPGVLGGRLVYSWW